MRRLAGQAGQTAAEYMGVLLVVSVIIGILATGDLGRVLRESTTTLICRIAETEDCKERQSGPADDRDGDGISNARERRAGLNPDKSDTDNDGIADRRELEIGTDPTLADSDRDGIPDRKETTSPDHRKLDPTNPDTDGDGLTDGEEAAIGTNGAEADSDGYGTPGDGLTDAEELALGTDPNAYDSDRDGYPDGYEHDRGTDPTSDGRTPLQKIGGSILDNPFDYLLPTGAAAKFLSKQLLAKARTAYKALREAKTLKELNKARQDMLAVFRERMRRTPKPDPVEEAQRRELLERLATALDQRKRKLERDAARQKRRDELAYDPDTKSMKELEADDALRLEDLGHARGPIRRSTGKGREAGADFVDRNGQRYDHKQAISRPDQPFDAEGFVGRVERNDIAGGEKIVINEAKLDAADRAALRAEIERRGLGEHFIFLPRDP